MRFCVGVALAYAAAATLAWIAFLLDGDLRAWLLGLWPGPWAADLDASEHPGRFVFFGALWLAAVQIGLILAVLLRRRGDRRAVRLTIGSGLLIFGMLDAAFEVWHLLDAKTWTGLDPFTPLEIIGGAWLLLDKPAAHASPTPAPVRSAPASATPSNQPTAPRPGRVVAVEPRRRVKVTPAKLVEEPRR